VVLTDAEAVEAHSIGDLNLLDELRDAVSAPLSVRASIGQHFHKTIDSNPHNFSPKFHPSQIY
jgi:hypothetical protein